MKRIASFLIIAAMLFSLAACSVPEWKRPERAETETPETETARRGTEAETETAAPAASGTAASETEETQPAPPVTAAAGTEPAQTDAPETGAEETVPPETEDRSVRFAKLANGSCHIAAIDTDGRLWCWGKNQYGSLGETESAFFPPKLLVSGTVFTDVDCGQDFSVALDENGNVWTWGHNSSGQLGNGTTEDSTVPQIVLTGCKAVAAGYNYAFALSEAGELYFWGDGSRHCLPRTDPNNTNTETVPVKFESDAVFTLVDAGGTAGGGTAIDENGNRLVWGAYNSMLGFAPQQLGYDSDIILYTAKTVQDPFAISKIRLGNTTSFAIDTEGRLYASGGRNALLGSSLTGTGSAAFTPVDAGAVFASVCEARSFVLALDSEGGIWGWSSDENPYGYLTSVPARIPVDTCFTSLAAVYYIETEVYAIDPDGLLWRWSESGSVPERVQVELPQP